MRARFYVLIIVILALLSFVYRLVGFIKIFSEHAGIALTQKEIADTHPRNRPDPRPELIPKIIHQVYHDWSNQSMPSDWDEVRQTCIDLNPGWEYKLWTLESSRDFIATNYPGFLSTYDSYKYPVQRVDTVRYHLLLHYGGIYLDLDNGCLENLDPLLYYPTWTTDGGRGALSNNILASRPNHPFWTLLTNSLIPYNWNYFFPYITISYASGQWFETAIWETYHNSLPRLDKSDTDPENRLYRIMMDDRPGTEPWIFFSQARGGSWVNWDNALFLWIGDHLLLEAFGLCAIIGGTWWMAMRCVRRKSSRPDSDEYTRLAGVRARKEDDEV